MFTVQYGSCTKHVWYFNGQFYTCKLTPTVQNVQYCNVQFTDAKLLSIVQNLQKVSYAHKETDKSKYAMIVRTEYM